MCGQSISPVEVKTLFVAFLGLRPVALGKANSYNKPHRPGRDARSMGRSEGAGEDWHTFFFMHKKP